MSDTNQRMDELKNIEKHLGAILKDVDPNLTKPPKNNDEYEDDSNDDITEDDRYRMSFRETMREIVYVFGGPKGVARIQKDNYDNAPPGSNTRARIAGNILQGLQDHGEDNDVADDESMAAIDKELRTIHTEEMLEKLPEDLRAQVVEFLT